MAIQNIQAFSTDLDRFVRAIDDEIANARNIVAREAIERLADASPVLTGTYIYNHRVSDSGASDFKVTFFPRELGDQSPTRRAAKKAVLGAEMTMREILKLAGMKGSGKIIVVDNLTPYADEIELGSSKMYAPSGVYRIVLSHLETVADQLIAAMPEKIF